MIKNKILIDILLNGTKVIKYLRDGVSKKGIFLVLQFCKVTF